MPSVVGQWAHIVGAEPTWIYLPEEPDYSKHLEARKPDRSSSDDPEGEESEEETVEVEETDGRAAQEAQEEAAAGTPGRAPLQRWRLNGMCPRTSTAPRRSGPLLPHLRPGNGRSPCVQRHRRPRVARSRSTCHCTSAPSQSLSLTTPRRQGRLNLKALLQRSVRNLLSLSGRLRNVGDARAPLYTDGPWSRRRPRTSLRRRQRSRSPRPRSTCPRTVGPRLRATKSEPSKGRYVPPRKRARQEVPASSSVRDPAYGVTSAARSVLLGEMLQSRVSRREDLQKAFDNKYDS